MWLPGDKKRIEVHREWELGNSGAWVVEYGNTKVYIGGWRNRIAVIFDGHPPRPKQKHIDKAVGKALRLDAESEGMAHDAAIEHANLVVEARKELE